MSSRSAVIGVVAVVVLASPGCGDGSSDDVVPGFASATADVCDTRTSSVGLTTANGGRLALEVRDACGRVVGTCRGVDVYAPAARGSVRFAGGSIFLDDCTITALPGATLVATFTLGDSSTPSERYELALTGACRSDGGLADGGTTSCPRDAGAAVSDGSVPLPDAARPDAARLDASSPRDGAP